MTDIIQDIEFKTYESNVTAKWSVIPEDYYSKLFDESLEKEKYIKALPDEWKDVEWEYEYKEILSYHEGKKLTYRPCTCIYKPKIIKTVWNNKYDVEMPVIKITPDVKNPETIKILDKLKSKVSLPITQINGDVTADIVKNIPTYNIDDFWKITSDIADIDSNTIKEFFFEGLYNSKPLIRSLTKSKDCDPNSLVESQYTKVFNFNGVIFKIYHFNKRVSERDFVLVIENNFGYTAPYLSDTKVLGQYNIAYNIDHDDDEIFSGSRAGYCSFGPNEKLVIGRFIDTDVLFSNDDFNIEDTVVRPLFDDVLNVIK